MAHLFLHYAVTIELWSLAFCLSGVSCVMPSALMELLSCWKGHFGKRGNGAIWKVAPLSLIRFLWRKRTAHCFEWKEQNLIK